MYYGREVPHPTKSPTGYDRHTKDPEIVVQKPLPTSIEVVEAVCPQLVKVQETVDDLVGQLEDEIRGLDQQRNKRTISTDEVLRVTAGSKILNRRARISEDDTTTTERFASQAGALQRLVRRLQSLRQEVAETMRLPNYRLDQLTQLRVTEHELSQADHIVTECDRLGLDTTMAEELKRLLTNRTKMVDAAGKTMQMPVVEA